MPEINETPDSKKSATTPSLVVLSPPDILTFNLNKEVEVKTVLHIENISGKKIVYKVKTTQPSWYFVRPSQAVIDVGKSEDIEIVIIESITKQLLDQSSSGDEEKQDKHRFLVQTKVIDDDNYNRVLENGSKPEEFTRIWSIEDNEKKNMRLKVSFVYPSKKSMNITSSSSTSETLLSPSSTSSHQTNKTPNHSLLKPPALENEQIVQNRLNMIKSSVADGKRKTNDSNLQCDNTQLLNELLNLQKKYDSVVEYTVHLTAERDTIVAQLDEVKKDLARKRNIPKSLLNKDKEDMNKKTNTKLENNSSKDMPLYVVVLAALLFWLIGRFWR